jgi:predicted regulator of Ras-like GTPase activity (Roadblock/LC7/MglB family)
MSMQAILQEAVERVRGAKLAGVVGTDGLGVEMVLADGVDTPDRELVDVELGSLAALATQASARLGAGDVQDLIVEAEQTTYLASRIIPGYYAVLGVAANGGNLGRARFAVRQMVSRLQNEL